MDVSKRIGHTASVPERDRHLAGAIDKRRKELGLDVQTLAERTGLTRQGLQPILRGDRKRYQDRLKLPLCQALEWTPDSIDRLLDGLEPIVQPAKRTASPEQRLASLERRVSALVQLLLVVVGERRADAVSESSLLAEHVALLLRDIDDESAPPVD